MKNSIYLGILHPLFSIAFLLMLLSVAKSLQPHHFISGTSNDKGRYSGEQSHMYPQMNSAKIIKTVPKTVTVLTDSKKISLNVLHKWRKRRRAWNGMYPTGSSLPDCSHACGPCFPCKRVTVSFKCSTESCPIVYKCLCKGKYYHVPSN